jgi:biotin carboxyl carrier protein
MIADASTFNGPGPRGEGPLPPRRKPSKSLLTITLITLAALIVAYEFWYGTWFGRKLSPAQMRTYMTDKEHPRRAQHALVQLTSLLDSGDPAARELFPLVIDLARHERLEVRGTAAWVMGWDNQHQPFHDALRELVLDPSPFVQRNAALALSKFGDPAARPVLRSMLSAFTVKSPAAGTIHKLMARGTAVHPNVMIAEIAGGEGPPRHLPAPVSGRITDVFVADGAKVGEGDAIYELAPAEEDIFESLRALVLVGTADDLELVRAAPNRSGSTQRIAEQAPKTIAAIESRSVTHATSSNGE